MRKPYIALTIEDGFDQSGNANLVARKQDLTRIEEAGGIPLAVLDIRNVEDYVSQCDALYLSDGGPIHPARSGGLITDFEALQGFSRTRDDLEFALVSAFLAQGKPIYGEGRGAQIIALVTGHDYKTPELADFVETIPLSAQPHTKPAILLDAGPAVCRLDGTEGWVTNRTYPLAVAAGGAAPYLFLNENLADEAAEFGDGLLLTGTMMYSATEEGRETLRPRQEERITLGKKVFAAFTQMKKPVFGICQGFQTINEWLGGTLDRMFKERTGVEHLFTAHPITNTKGSLLEQLFGETFIVNSRHQIRLGDVADGLAITAVSDHDTAEAYEHETLPIYGVEFHPERMRGELPEPPDGPDMTPLFAAWSKICKENAGIA